MAKKSGKVYVIGHKNPDTDSICSAIAYAELKKTITGEEYVARRAGQINEETQYVLSKFGVKAPELLKNVKLQVKDMAVSYTHLQDRCRSFQNVLCGIQWNWHRRSV